MLGYSPVPPPPELLAGAAPPILAPTIMDALHPPAAATAEVRAADSTGNLRALRGIELHAGVALHNDELHSSKQQGDIALALKAHVASICFNCFICLKGMLQGFCMDVVKVDRDVAYVAMVVHICCKRLFPMFHLFFQIYVASVFI
jgi:hypothetical protein